MAEIRQALLAFASRKPKMVKAELPELLENQPAATRSVVIPYKVPKVRASRQAQGPLGLKNVSGTRKMQKAGLSARHALAAAR